MKRTIFFGILMIFMMSASMAFAGKADRKSASDNSAATVKTENKLSEEEISRLTKRVEEIRSMDKSNMTSVEKRELRKELRGIKENVQKRDGVIYIGAGTLILIIIILILVL
jgi:peptidoglycan hydrolase CwlO-like protein